MFKPLLIPGALLALFLSATPAMAEGAHFLLGVEAGQGRITLDGQHDAGDTGWQTYLGVTPEDSGLEARFAVTGLGRYDIGADSVSVSGVFFEALPKWSLNCNQDDLYLKLGVGGVRLSGANVSVTMATTQAADSVVLPAWESGVGYRRHLGYWPNSHWTIQLEWQRYSFLDSDYSGDHADVFTAGVGFVF